MLAVGLPEVTKPNMVSLEDRPPLTWGYTSEREGYTCPSSHSKPDYKRGGWKGHSVHTAACSSPDQEEWAGKWHCWPRSQERGSRTLRLRRKSSAHSVVSLRTGGGRGGLGLAGAPGSRLSRAE